MDQRADAPWAEPENALVPGEPAATRFGLVRAVMPMTARSAAG